ncbi:hypothetical protein B0I35DRAFT_458594 [Stachybotrys elegans]|uniref:Uncharacterized protein n=1 Tax=Stachybotrys elegans TaxID=80388 RepID=A0A8K0WUQ3_9HYPO|nr:hypothetical protein B0I35DRAFT_458594 [Stachybotrys elegans]
MHTFKAVLLLAQLSAVFAFPAPSATEARFISRNGAIAPSPGAGATPGAREEEGEEGGENEVQGQFDTPIVLKGGDTRTDVLFPPGQNGVFEVEFQNGEDRTLTVSKNTKPAPPPAGFLPLEAFSFVVSLAEGADGVALQSIDYILNAGNALDISKGVVGRFCKEAGAFVIDPAVGELEFEAEENELKLVVKNMNAEWAAFIPDPAAAAAPPAAAPPAAAPPAAGGAAGQEKIQKIVELLVSLLN